MSDNRVQVDEAALAAEAAGVVAELETNTSEAAPGAAGGDVDPGTSSDQPPAAGAAGESWSGVIESVTPLMREIVFAQWVVTPGQWQAWEQGMIRSMDQCFPGGIEGKYGGFVQAGLIMAGVTVANVVRNGGKMPPLGPPRRAAEEKPGAPADAPAH